ncbi:MAG TPA: hypothetical protein VKG91_13155 [Roseiarcus sp.]|nr:hypothetical protein [Roseiarcus sp.]
MSAAASLETAFAAPLLEVRDIEKAFPGVRALSGVRPGPRRNRRIRLGRRMNMPMEAA